MQIIFNAKYDLAFSTIQFGLYEWLTTDLVNCITIREEMFFPGVPVNPSMRPCNTIHFVQKGADVDVDEHIFGWKWKGKISLRFGGGDLFIS